MKIIILIIALISFNISYGDSEKIEVKIAVFPFKPMIYQNEDGKADGFFYDILESIAEKEGWKTKYIFGTWKEGLERIKKGEVDIVTSCAYTDERKEFMIFTKESSFTVWSQVFTKKGSKINSLFELRDKKIGIMKNDFNGIEFIKLMEKFSVEYNIIYFDTFIDIYRELDKGKIDAGVTAVTNSYAMEKEYQFEKTPIVFNPFNLYFTVKNGNNKYADIIDKHLKELKSNQNSFYYKSLEYWIGVGKDTKTKIPKYIIYSGLILITVITWLILISYFLKHKITEATKEINEKNKQLEEKMKEIVEQRNKAEKASNIKSEFLANMSHEIRTPLNGIAGMTELLECESLTKEQKQYIENLKVSKNNLIEIVDDILDISKIETGNTEIQIIDFDIAEIFETVKNRWSIQAENKKIELNFNIEESIPEYIKGDYYKIKQILTNLISNAVKFTEKGKVIIEVKKIREENKKIELNFTVKDTGIGIKEEQKESLFQPFVQGDQSFSKKYQGLGLGLSISKRNAELLGGELLYKSQIGVGTEFNLKIEVEKSDRVKKNEDKKVEIKDKRIQILIAEDNYINMEMTVKMVKMCGDFIIYKATTGKEAVKIYKENRADIIFMDIQMPEMSGIDAFKEIKLESKTIKIETPIVIAMTAYATRIDMEYFRNIGMDEYIPKPFLLKDIKEILKKYTIRSNI